MSQRFTITLDAADPKALGTFWATALGYVEEPPPKPYATWRRPSRVGGCRRRAGTTRTRSWTRMGRAALLPPEGPEPKTAKNRLHLDVWVPGETRENPASPDDKRAHAAFLVEHGATVLHEVDHPSGMGFWVVMADPEGNEFCVV
jgi:hypothetical protein